MKKRLKELRKGKRWSRYVSRDLRSAARSFLPAPSGGQRKKDPRGHEGNQSTGEGA